MAEFLKQAVPEHRSRNAIKTKHTFRWPFDGLSMAFRWPFDGLIDKWFEVCVWFVGFRGSVLGISHLPLTLFLRLIEFASGIPSYRTPKALQFQVVDCIQL